MADKIEHCDRRTLQQLIERGSMTLRDIMESAEIDRFPTPLAQAWVDSALARGLIAETGSNESTRYHVTAAGRDAARVSTGRFVARETARDGEPSRRS
jgi:hypothetical protein